MNNDEKKLIFYSLGSEKFDFSKLTVTSDFEENKPVGVSNNFNKALNKVLDNDINFLSNKINKITSNVKKYLAIRNIDIILNDIKLDNIDSIINTMETKVSELIIEKGNNKIGVFTSKKRDKKEKNIKCNECIDYLSKSITDLVSIQNEYNNITKKKINIQFENDVETPDEDDPLERTISFYMNKENV